MKLIMILLFLPFSDALGLTRPLPDNAEIKIANQLLKRAKVKRHSKSWEKIVEVEFRMGLCDEFGGNREPMPQPPAVFYHETERKEYLEKLQAFEDRRNLAYRRLRENHPELIESYAAAKRQYVEDLKDSQYLYRDAFHRIAREYGIAPKKRSGPILSGAPAPRTEYEQASHLGEQADWDQNFDSKMQGDLGLTYPDGRITIGLDALENIDRIALTLYHETLHFDSLLAVTPDHWNEPAMEAKVRREGLPYLKSVFNQSDAEIKAYKAYIDTRDALAKQWAAVKREGFSPYNLFQKAMFPELTGHHRLESPNPDPAIKGRLEDIRRGERQLEEQVQAESRRRHLAQLGGLADAGCESGVVMQASLDALSPQPPDVYPRQASMQGGACRDNLEAEMFDILRRGDRLDAGWMNKRASNLREEEGLLRPVRLAEIEVDEVVRRACASKGGLIDSDLDALSWFPNPLVLLPPHVVSDDCQYWLYAQLWDYNSSHSRRNGTVNINWINWQARLFSVPPPMRPVEPDWKAKHDLHRLAYHVCDAPNTVTPDFFRRQLRGFPDGDTDTRSVLELRDPGCTRDLLIDLMAFNGSWAPGTTLNLEWLLARAAELREKHASRQQPPQGGGGGDDGSRGRSGPGYNHCIDPGNSCFGNRPPRFLH